MSDPDIEINLHGLPKLMSNQRLHWRARHAQLKKWKDLVHQRIIIDRLKPLLPFAKARLILTRYAHGAQPDFDNLVSSWKGVIDGLVAGSVLVDDKPDVIGSPEFFWHKAKPREGKIKIQIWEIKQ